MTAAAITTAVISTVRSRALFILSTSLWIRSHQLGPAAARWVRYIAIARTSTSSAAPPDRRAGGTSIPCLPAVRRIVRVPRRNR